MCGHMFYFFIFFFAHRYLSFPSIAGEPPIQLKGFQKTKILSISESITITLLLNDRDVSIWNVVEHHFSGEFVLYKFIVFRALPSTIKIFLLRYVLLLVNLTYINFFTWLLFVLPLFSFFLL